MVNLSSNVTNNASHKQQQQQQQQQQQKQQQQPETGQSDKSNCEINGKQGDQKMEIDLELVKQVRQLVRQEFESNCEKTADNGNGRYSKIHYEHIMQLEKPQTCWRYLLENDLNVDKSVGQIKRNLLWRQQNQIDTLRPEQFVKEFSLKAPIGFTAVTDEGHTLLWVIAKDYRKPDSSEAKVMIKQYVLNFVATWEREHQNDFAKLLMVFDVRSTSYRNLDLEFSAWMVQLFDYLPSRIEFAYIVGVPFLMRPIIRLIISWLPDFLRLKVRCCAWEDLFDESGPGLRLEHVPRDAGGQAHDSWRLAPRQVPWVRQADPNKFTDKLLRQIDAAIFFNKTEEQFQKLVQMQQEFDGQKN